MTNPPPSAFDREKFLNLLAKILANPVALAFGDSKYLECQPLLEFMDEEIRSNISRVLDEVDKTIVIKRMAMRGNDCDHAFVESLNIIQAIKSRELGEGKS